MSSTNLFECPGTATGVLSRQSAVWTFCCIVEWSFFAAPFWGCVCFVPWCFVVLLFWRRAALTRAVLSPAVLSWCCFDACCFECVLFCHVAVTLVMFLLYFQSSRSAPDESIATSTNSSDSFTYDCPKDGRLQFTLGHKPLWQRRDFSKTRQQNLEEKFSWEPIIRGRKQSDHDQGSCSQHPNAPPWPNEFQHLLSSPLTAIKNTLFFFYSYLPLFLLLLLLFYWNLLHDIAVFCHTM